VFFVSHSTAVAQGYCGGQTVRVPERRSEPGAQWDPPDMNPIDLMSFTLFPLRRITPVRTE
jgi:hypothetical protein